MNKRLNLILFIVICLLLAALVSRNGSMALLSIPFLVYVCIGLLKVPVKVDLHATRRLSALRSDEGRPVDMQITLKNHGTSIPRLQWSETSPASMRVIAGTLAQRFSLPAGGRVDIAYTFSAPRGRYRWETLRVTAGDPFGLFEKPLTLDAQAAALIWPQQLRLQRFRFQPRPTIRTAGPYLSRLPGTGLDFWGVREYQPGDSMRLIHWRLAARHPGSFYSKVQEREEMADIGILLDARAAAYRFNGDEGLLEYAMLAAATLTKYYLSSGNRVSMLALNDNLVRVFPGYGKHQLMRILDQLSSCTPGERDTFTSMKYLPTKLFPRHSVVVLISPVQPADLNAITRLVAKDYQLLLVSPNPVHWAAHKNHQKESAYTSYALRAATLERALTLKRIRKLGAQTIDWKVDQPLLKTLQSARFINKRGP